MPGNYTGNTDPAIRAIVHSQTMLEVLQDEFLPDILARDVTDFGDGTSLQIPTIGEMTLFDLEEGQPTPSSAIDTGTIALTITAHRGVAGYVSDELKEDGYKAAAVEAQIVPSSLRAIKESYETDLLATAVSSLNGMITLSDTNVINGFAHRWIADGGTVNHIEMKDFVYAKLAMDKANVPDEGRIAIVDPIVEASLNNLTNLVNVSNNPQFQGMVETGFAKGRKFIRNIMGFDIYTSNRLPRIAGETMTTPEFGDTVLASAATTGGVNNIFMSVYDDMHKPFMTAMRRMPRVEGERNVSERRDEYHVTSRWGFAPQRAETLISVITDLVSYE